MPKPARQHLKQTSLDGAVPELALEALEPWEDRPPQPVARFFGVPFLKGTAREVTAIHLCPAMVHVATIRDGSQLEVANRLTLQRVDLGALATARLVAFRPAHGRRETHELAIVGPMDKPDIARYDLHADKQLTGLSFQGATVVQYSGDGQFVAAGNGRGQVKVWHLGAAGPTPVLEAAFAFQVESLAFHPEHPTLYATLASGALEELAMAPSPAAPAVPALRERAGGVRFQQVAAGRRGFCLYLAGRDDRVYVFDTATGEVGAFWPQVGPILNLQVLPASGYVCVVGAHAIYLLPSVGPGQMEHRALVCPFKEAIYAACELDHDAVLIFHAAETA